MNDYEGYVHLSVIDFVWPLDVCLQLQKLYEVKSAAYQNVDQMMKSQKHKRHILYCSVHVNTIIVSLRGLHFDL